MISAVEEPDDSMAANAADADDDVNALETVDVDEGMSVDTSTNLPADPADHHVDSAGTGETDEAVEEKSEADKNEDDEDDLLRGWDPSRDNATPSSPIDYTNVDETPYEHNFEPGDHIIRWDMLPILWPIQIHGIVLEVSEDKSEVTICDFGVTSGKKEDKIESQTEQVDKLVEEENAKFTEAIQDECQDSKEEELSVSTDASLDSSLKKKERKGVKKHQRLNVVKLTKWSDLKKWHKVNYEGGLLNTGKGGVGKGLKTLGKKTGKLWTSMTKSFAKNDAAPKDEKKVWRSVRYEFDEKGFCVHHPHIQLKRLKDDGKWAILRKKCPECILQDCPAMLGEEESPKSSLESAPSFSSTEDETSVSPSKASLSDEIAPEDSNKPEESNADKLPPSGTLGGSSQSNDIDNIEAALRSTVVDAEDEVNDDNDIAQSESDKMEGDAKTLAQLMAEANEIEIQSRKTVVKVCPSPERKPGMGDKRSSWHGSFMKSLSNIFPQKNDEPPSNLDSTSEEEQTKTSPGENGEAVTDSEKQPNSSDPLPRSDPPVLVLARTRFILERGENILPPYHIINSNSECIAVWCKTGRWSTLQASVFLHSTAIGHAKSATALTLGVAATQPWLIPAFATVGLAAVGTPWLYLKIANDKWNEATRSLTEKFWMQAEPAVFVECIEKWGKMK
ncbi:hypothetical protein ACHAXR_010442 [Thalassiosira sp. AJA248-18]